MTFNYQIFINFNNTNFFFIIFFFPKSQIIYFTNNLYILFFNIKKLFFFLQLTLFSEWKLDDLSHKDIQLGIWKFAIRKLSISIISPCLGASIALLNNTNTQIQQNRKPISGNYRLIFDISNQGHRNYPPKEENFYQFDQQHSK